MPFSDFLYVFLSCVLLVTACKSTKHAEPFRIQLRKTACKGKCPAYLITITGDKKLVFEGQHFTKVEGTHVTALSEQEYDSLRILVEQSQFFELDSPKDTRIMDISFTYIEILEGKKQRKLKFANQLPTSIQPLLTYLEELTIEKGFVQKQ